jgi:plasmid maintenance system antidote protein VapI
MAQSAEMPLSAEMKATIERYKAFIAVVETYNPQIPAHFAMLIHRAVKEFDISPVTIAHAMEVYPVTVENWVSGKNRAIYRNRVKGQQKLPYLAHRRLYREEVRTFNPAYYGAFRALVARGVADHGISLRDLVKATGKPESIVTEWLNGNAGTFSNDTCLKLKRGLLDVL